MSLASPVAVLLPGVVGEKPAKQLEVAVNDPAQPSLVLSCTHVQELGRSQACQASAGTGQVQDLGSQGRIWLSRHMGHCRVQLYERVQQFAAGQCSMCLFPESGMAFMQCCCPGAVHDMAGRVRRRHRCQSLRCLLASHEGRRAYLLWRCCPCAASQWQEGCLLSLAPCCLPGSQAVSGHPAHVCDQQCMLSVVASSLRLAARLEAPDEHQIGAYIFNGWRSKLSPDIMHCRW